MKKVILLLTAMTTASLVGPVQAAGQGDYQPPVFADMDTNGDGQISKAELQAFMAAKAADRFAQMDSNQDGSVTRAEIVAMASGDAQSRAERRADKMLDRLDANGNGALETDELKPFENRGDRVFARLDQDDNGSLSEDEFERLIQRMGKRARR
ncbi:MAG: calcium-binding protein [Pseudomonadota bacterium]